MKTIRVEIKAETIEMKTISTEMKTINTEVDFHLYRDGFKINHVFEHFSALFLPYDNILITKYQFIWEVY
jgi:hypothetical protein